MPKVIRGNPELLQRIKVIYFSRDPPPTLPLTQLLCAEQGITVSISTLRRYLNGVYDARAPRYGLRHNTCHTEKREYFARAMIEDLEAFYGLAYSDEKKFCFTGSVCAPKVWLEHPGDRRYIRDKVSAPLSIMVHGVITWSGAFLLTHVPSGSDGSMVNGEYYASLIEHRVRPFLEKLEEATKKPVFFQQDNAPPHASAVAACALRKINTLGEWPPRSPDFSPIEHIWAVAQSKITVRLLAAPQNMNADTFSCLVNECCNEAAADPGARQSAWNRCLRALQWAASHGGEALNNSR